ncbi:unnamed protein product [Rotaria socialis]|uniref:Macrocin O-methyltransferase n=1 Tax=Rotaria socialis TaxID=392032 RepID=A0A820TT31_9BILA|nr:unnamed protein product [Rotaria socialis]CAF4475571.1 unnamed protein product [Rotaria socialis]
MTSSFIYGIAAGIALTFITLLAMYNGCYYFSSSAFYSNNNIFRRTSHIRHIRNISYEGYQFFVFSDESPMVRANVDVVRDTVCGLALRTQERAYVDNKTRPMDINQRIKGLDWPLTGITMVGQRRLINIEWAIRFVIANGVKGDYIECGVWRGGSSIFARAVLKALNNNDRHVWLADSFQGLPKARTPHDTDIWSKMEYLKVSLEEVQTNFRSFNLLDDRVHFCKGYFVDSLPRCNVSRLAVLRMDGDMYESTMDQLFNLYSKLQVGGVIIIDDYSIEECFRAIVDFRTWHNITEEILSIPGDETGRCWIKRKAVQLQKDQYARLVPKTKS